MANFFKMMSPKYFMSTAKRYGGDVDVKRLFLTIVGVMAGAAAVCYYLKLQWYYIIVMMIFSALITPSVLITIYKNKYENLRFEEATNYCEQMIYSFRKKQKIRVALEDVYGTSTGHLHEVVEKMIDYIDTGHSKVDLYAEALDMMQQEYDCSRIDTLHNYIKEVETNGGDSRKALMVLLNDIKDWSTTTLTFQRKRENVRKNVGISIVLALFTCSMMFTFIPEEYVDSIIDSIIYQVATVITLVVCELIFLFISGKIAGSYLDNEQRKNEINNAAVWVRKIENYDDRKERKNMIMMLIVSLAAAVVCYIMDLGYITIVPIVVGIYFIYDYNTKLSNYKKKLTKEINLVFPTWLRNLILHLQTDNVHVALANSLRSCPEVIKPEVRKLLIGISNEPNSIEPYVQFMDGYNLPELKSAIRFLYSLAEFGSDDMVTQLDQLIQQNAILSAAAEDLKNENSLSVLSTLTYMPMLVSCAKLVVDMALFFSSFMGMMSSLG